MRNRAPWLAAHPISTLPIAITRYSSPVMSPRTMTRLVIATTSQQKRPAVHTDSGLWALEDSDSGCGSGLCEAARGCGTLPPGLAAARLATTCA